MRKKINLIGQRFGRLIVLEEAKPYVSPKGRRAAQFHCLCDCGNRKPVRSDMLRLGKIRSCGCLLSDTMRVIKRSHGHSTGNKHSSEYLSWQAMRARCNSPSNKSYHRYGGRGIAVCPEWDSFETFLRDMGKKPTPTHTIERLNANADYFKQNCVWLEKSKQPRNTCRNRYATINGQTKIIKDWAAIYKIPYSTVTFRMNSRGWCAECAVTIPPRGGVCPHH